MNGKSRAFVPLRSGWSLSHLHVQMARELGMNPSHLGKNHRQEPWKLPQTDFVARIYIKQFNKMPDVVTSVEEVAAAEMAKREARSLQHGEMSSGPEPARVIPTAS